MIELQFITGIKSFFGTDGDVEQTEGERVKRTRQSRENRCSDMSVYFTEDICEASEHGALGDYARYIPSRHITGIPKRKNPVSYTMYTIQGDIEISQLVIYLK